MDSQTRTLLKKSAEDEQTLSVTTISDTIAAFHAQQAVEKLLKDWHQLLHGWFAPADQM